MLKRIITRKHKELIVWKYTLSSRKMKAGRGWGDINFGKKVVLVQRGRSKVMAMMEDLSEVELNRLYRSACVAQKAALKSRAAKANLEEVQ